ncbi:hypothetical protein GCM10009557_59180 [Virgisporangium ochraceum]|uniref:Uncharacterized protein n=1 Tax=Virgisporangium ochraceum TaxID=65505 RepID=A0A8J4EEK3_9ACTN|nr:hypothetical protein [Virgisporangium ochraceum]GIJ71713.1 hypothetical protein Voc01_066300 [Virgisporangium ochraceum]
MWVVLAIVLMLVPVGVVYCYEQAGKRGYGPLAEHPRPTVSAPMPTTPVFTDPRDAERCAVESRLVRQLLDGTLDRAGYRAGMAGLAAGGASPPVQLPDDPGGCST